MTHASVADFHTHSRYLRALAYRMLGSRAEAEDVVQDAWLRWQSADRSAVENVRAFLSRTVTNLCLDRLQSAQARREQYVGVWLPEPLVDEAMDYHPGPDVATEHAQDVSIAFMLTLERLSALERAAFLLHDVFDLDFDEVARRLQRSPAAVRQLASRARQRVKADYARHEVASEEGARLLQAFGQAVTSGDVDGLAQLLVDDAEFLSDGGGVVTAVPKPLHGAQRVARALVGFAKVGEWDLARMQPADINGLRGWLQYDTEGRLVQALALRAGPDGRVASVYVVRNPHKLQHLRQRSQQA